MPSFPCMPACHQCKSAGVCDGSGMPQKRADAPAGILGPGEDSGRVGRDRAWQPNLEPDTELKCGCFIPWPIVRLLGSGGKVQCDKHGWQPKVSKKEVQRSERLTKTFTLGQETLDDCPF